MRKFHSSLLEANAKWQERSSKLNGLVQTNAKWISVIGKMNWNILKPCSEKSYFCKWFETFFDELVVYVPSTVCVYLELIEEKNLEVGTLPVPPEFLTVLMDAIRMS